MAVIDSILGILIIIVLFVALGWFYSRGQERSRQRFDDNNRAGTLRTEAYRRPQVRRGRNHDEGDSEFDDY